MAAEEIDLKLAEQLLVVVDKAREIFVDLMEEHVRRGKISIGSIGEPDKRTIERLFSDVVYGHIVAEAMAIFSVLVYTQLKDDSVLNVVAPSFLDRCEGKTELIGDTVTRKISGLPARAGGVLESGALRSGVAHSLLDDLAGMTEARPLRASFDAVALSLLGE